MSTFINAFAGAEARLAKAQDEARQVLANIRGDEHEMVLISMKSFYGLRGIGWCSTIGTKKLSVKVLRKMYEDSVVKQVTRVLFEGK